MAVTKRKITLQGKDGENIASFISKTLQNRKGSKFRKIAEAMWKEVDRQVAMEGMDKTPRNSQQQLDWQSAIELGELSRASEVLSADIRRMAFPQNRSWFDPHIQISAEDIQKASVKAGRQITPEEYQTFVDGALRALMAQQHLDFAFKARQDLSIKEALHHGGYVSEVQEMSMLGSTPDGSIEEISAPVWVPHSMWNCYPDDSPSVTPGTLFYTGSMIICSYMSHNAINGVSGGGWLTDAIKELEDPKEKDHEIAWYHGDITIPRTKGKDIFLPNVKCGAIKDKLVFYEANELPYLRIIYNGYERLDVRNPYFISPLMKMSPTQKIASTMSNKLIDSVDLKIEKPIVYDGNDPDMVRNGGPDISPGGKTPSKNMAAYKEIDVGDPQAALSAAQFFIAELQKGTSVDSIRSGMSSSVEQTATEVERTRQGGQIRTVDFLDKHELQGLRPFLYLQHESNKKNLKRYQFYSQEMDSPDFVTVKNADLPKKVHFDVVGSKGLIEEQQRQQATMQVTTFLFNVGAGHKVDIDKLAKEMYQDAGNKNPERFLRLTDEKTAMQQLEAMQMQFQQAQEQMQALAQENQELKAGEETKIQEIQAKSAIEMARQDNEEDKIKAKAEHDMEKLRVEAEIKQQEAQNKLIIEERKLDNQREIELFKAFISKAELGEKEEGGENEMTDMMAKFQSALDKFTRAQTARKRIQYDDEGRVVGVESEQDDE